MRHKFPKGTKVWYGGGGGCGEPEKKILGVVLGNDPLGNVLVGFPGTFDGHSGHGEVKPIPKKYEDHCWWVPEGDLVATKVKK